MPHRPFGTSALPAVLLVRPDFLDAGTLQAVSRVLDADPGKAAEVQPPGRRTWHVDADARRAWEVALPDEVSDRVVGRIERLRPALEAHFSVGLEPCDAVAALRYPPGAYYRLHRDVSDSPDDEVSRRAVSLVIFVNDGEVAPAYEGGRLRLYGPRPVPAGASPVDAPARAGTLVAFPSDWLHEVTPVASGERRTVVTWLLREETSTPK